VGSGLNCPVVAQPEALPSGCPVVAQPEVHCPVVGPVLIVATPTPSDRLVIALILDLRTEK
jgi:hypothetical protein